MSVAKGTIVQFLNRGRPPQPAVRRQSDIAFEKIYRAIIQCELPPGAIISEAELSARFDLRRASACAAVDRLSVMGMLRPVRRRGYQVKPVTLRDINDLFQLRTIVEAATVRLAAGKVDRLALRRMNRICEAGYRPGDRESETRFLQANSEFHLMVAAVTGNDLLVGTLAQLLQEMERLFHFGLAPRNRTDEMKQEHRALVDALSNNCSDEAERLIREELATSRAMVLDALMSTRLLDVGISGIKATGA